MISESERGADMFYATRFRAPDPFVYLEHRGKKSLLLSDLEIDRGRREAKVDAVFSWSEFQKNLKHHLSRTPHSEEVIAFFLKQQGARSLMVPRDFPLGMAHDLKKMGITTTPVKTDFFPERAIKTPQEIAALKQALKNTEIGMARAHEILKSSTIKKNRRLEWAGQPLTSERLRCEIESAIVRAGGTPAGDSIVAGGEQACDPHERGHGPLRAHELIIIDLCPRDRKSGYYGDLTRTVVRGRASEGQRRLWNICLQGQEQVFKKLKAGAAGKKIHQSLQDFFTREGYPTEQKNGRWSGFFHGTGHGLGLEIHDLLRFGNTILKPGHVFTIEPGIYIPSLGGVRHEDVVVITEKGYRLLNKFPKMLEV